MHGKRKAYLYVYTEAQEAYAQSTSPDVCDKSAYSFNVFGIVLALQHMQK